MKVPPGEVYAEYENPRGHLGFYIESQGGPIPYRVKIRGPSLRESGGDAANCAGTCCWRTCRRSSGRSIS